LIFDFLGRVWFIKWNSNCNKTTTCITTTLYTHTLFTFSCKGWSCNKKPKFVHSQASQAVPQETHKFSYFTQSWDKPMRLSCCHKAKRKPIGKTYHAPSEIPRDKHLQGSHELWLLSTCSVTSRHVHVGEGGEKDLESGNNTFLFHVGLRFLVITLVFFFTFNCTMEAFWMYMSDEQSYAVCSTHCWFCHSEIGREHEKLR